MFVFLLVMLAIYVVVPFLLWGCVRGIFKSKLLVILGTIVTGAVFIGMLIRFLEKQKKYIFSVLNDVVFRGKSDLDSLILVILFFCSQLLIYEFVYRIMKKLFKN